MTSSAALFDRLSEEYEEHFAVPHRALYDDLAWEWIRASLPSRPGVVVDAGCGVGRWAERLIQAGHQVIGIEQAPGMVEASRRRASALPGQFQVIEQSMAEVELRPESATAVLALGSLQYVNDPASVVRRFAGWLRPGGVMALLVDSLLAMSAEHLRRGDLDAALAAGSTRRGTWKHRGENADLHLFDSSSLIDLMRRAGMRRVHAHGLLVSAGVLGVPALTDALERSPESARVAERRLSSVPALADLGKQLLVIGNRP